MIRPFAAHFPATHSFARATRGAPSFPRARELASRLLRSRPAFVVAWWAAMLVVFFVYTPLRAIADGSTFPVRGDGLERALFFGTLPSLWLQRHFVSIAPDRIGWTLLLIHGSWFFVPWAAALHVSVRRPRRIASFFSWWMLIFAIVLPIFALTPTRPPWMTDPHVGRIVQEQLGRQITDANPLAAMPSLHVALPLLIAFWFFREKWRSPGVLMLVYTALVAFEVVASGEHYVVDVIGAVLLAYGVVFLATAGRQHVRSVLSRWKVPRVLAPAGPTRETAAAAQPVARLGERAQGLIEFALLFPFIGALAFVIFDMSFAFDRRLVLQHAVADGARHAAVNPDIAATIQYTQDHSGNLLNNSDPQPNPKLKKGTVAVCFTDDDGDGKYGEVGDSVVVKANYNYYITAPLGGLLAAFGTAFGPINMNPSATERLETTASVPVANQC